MAPLIPDLQTLVPGGGLTLTVLSLVFLFIIIINLISLCTSCQRQSFELQHDTGGGVERSSSTLVRVVKLEDAMEGTDNAAADKEELDLSTIPQVNGEYTPWRNHTITQASGLPEESQAPAGIVVTNGVSTNMDGTATPRHRLPATPTIAPHKEVESNVQSAPPAVLVAADVATASAAPNESKGGSVEDWARAQADNMAKRNGGVGPETPNMLRIPEISSQQHNYETISEVRKHMSLELSDDSEEPLDVPSYQFVTQLEPYATSPPDLTDPPHPSTALHASTLVEVEEIANQEDQHAQAMYARVSKRIKCPTPPPLPPPDDEEDREEEEGVEENAPPLPERALNI